MPEIALVTPVFDADDMGDADLMVIHSDSAAGPGRVPVSEFLQGNGVALEDGDHNFGTVEIDTLTASAAAINELSVPTGLAVGVSGTPITKILMASGTITPANILAGAGETMTIAVTGATTGMHCMLAFAAALPDGLIPQAWVSAAGTVSVRLFNTTGSTITSASYTARLLLAAA